MNNVPATQKAIAAEIIAIAHRFVEVDEYVPGRDDARAAVGRRLARTVLALEAELIAAEDAPPAGELIADDIPDEPGDEPNERSDDNARETSIAAKHAEERDDYTALANNRVPGDSPLDDEPDMDGKTASEHHGDHQRLWEGRP